MKEINIYMYIYIYIVIHRQTVSLYHKHLVWLDTKDALNWDRKQPNFTLDLVSYRSPSRRHTPAYEL